jgi:hypothetical protein
MRKWKVVRTAQCGERTEKYFDSLELALDWVSRSKDVETHDYTFVVSSYVRPLFPQGF